ncbi:MAG: O-antigen polysaccharide polymerase Wzy [Blautia massiliensis (ex Durand et al. 2017)]|uniref:O-antigen polysaccharide polymerase Wzy n=1 Tax=Blautia massiliensis (ex Durand et al. 2017) TaxID=1737424 RepID=UPI003994A939
MQTHMGMQLVLDTVPCYFEELYIDYGYIGVFIGNIIYGLTFRLLSKIISDGKNVWKIAVGLFYVKFFISGTAINI